MCLWPWSMHFQYCEKYPLPHSIYETYVIDLSSLVWRQHECIGTDKLPRLRAMQLIRNEPSMCARPRLSMFGFPTSLLDLIYSSHVRVRLVRGRPTFGRGNLLRRTFKMWASPYGYGAKVGNVDVSSTRVVLALLYMCWYTTEYHVTLIGRRHRFDKADDLNVITRR